VFQQVVAVLERDGEVSIHKIEPGSETLSVRLTPQEVERFFEAYQAYNREQAGPEQPQEDEFYSLDDHPF
jgi:hypothetical protein